MEKLSCTRTWSCECQTETVWILPLRLPRMDTAGNLATQGLGSAEGGRKCVLGGLENEEGAKVRAEPHHVGRRHKVPKLGHWNTKGSTNDTGKEDRDRNRAVGWGLGEEEGGVKPGVGLREGKGG